MSFAHTTAQMRARTKDITRRIGWKNLKPGTELLAVEKAMLAQGREGQTNLRDPR